MTARFIVEATCPVTSARAGTLYTAHGPIQTPAFMPVGTQGTVKGLTPSDLRGIGARCVLANTYHLWLRPGPDIVAAAGGLHRFMDWDGPILTDSGGFQVLSLADLGQIEEKGAWFCSHLDGEERLLTPEGAMEVQAVLGSDVAMALDVCPPHPCSRAELADATERTYRWARRSLAAPHAQGQAVFGIVQGGMDPALRARQAAELRELPFDGFGIGGLSVGESRDLTWPALEAAVGALGADRPRYLMGVGAPSDLLEAVARGVDLFDCVLPTRLGRNGSALTRSGRIHLGSRAFAEEVGPLDPECDCPACTGYSVGYLHHLIRSREDLGLRMASLHNLRFLTRLLERTRDAIADGKFLEFWRRVKRAGRPSGIPTG